MLNTVQFGIGGLPCLARSYVHLNHGHGFATVQSGMDGLHRFSEAKAPPLVCSKYRLESLEVSRYSGVLWLHRFNGVVVLVEVVGEG